MLYLMFVFIRPWENKLDWGNNQKEIYFGLIWNIWWLWFDLPPARTASSLHPVLRGRTPRCTLKTMLKLWRFPFWPISYNHQTILTFCPKCWPGKDPGWSTQRLVRWTHTKCTGSEPGIYIIINNVWCAMEMQYSLNTMQCSASFYAFLDLRRWWWYCGPIYDWRRWGGCQLVITVIDTGDVIAIVEYVPHRSCAIFVEWSMWIMLSCRKGIGVPY